MARINVTKTYLPPLDEYQQYVQQIWESGFLTNQGPLLQTFESRAKDYLAVDHFQFVANGTVALQLALRGLDITEGEIITTPFSYVASTSAILWERCRPVYVDIDEATFCIDPAKIEAAITPNTRAILAVHVFGNPCDVIAIEAIAQRHNLPVIYDGAHAFGVQYQGKSLLSYGDVSTCSFHATKLFHTIEGGCVITSSQQVDEKVDLMKRFGHQGDDHQMLGINAKSSEFQAAMGLSNLPYVNDIIEQRKQASLRYDQLLDGQFTRQAIAPGTDYNYAYYPVVFADEQTLKTTLDRLNEHDIFPRRYFYPSLNTLPYLESAAHCPISEDIASRIVCLPLYAGLDDQSIERICKVITS